MSSIHVGSTPPNSRPRPSYQWLTAYDQLLSIRALPLTVLRRQMILLHGNRAEFNQQAVSQTYFP